MTNINIYGICSSSNDFYIKIFLRVPSNYNFWKFIIIEIIIFFFSEIILTLEIFVVSVINILNFSIIKKNNFYKSKSWISKYSSYLYISSQDVFYLRQKSRIFNNSHEVVKWKFHHLVIYYIQNFQHKKDIKILVPLNCKWKQLFSRKTRVKLKSLKVNSTFPFCRLSHRMCLSSRFFTRSFTWINISCVSSIMDKILVVMDKSLHVLYADKTPSVSLFTNKILDIYANKKWINLFQ